MAESEAFTAIPQLLTKVSEDFLWAAQVCMDRGYTEVNLNTGCPSGTVVSKGKGSGMLRSPQQLDAFLDTVFSRCPIGISVKTRLGLESPEEFPKLLEVFNHYPITELTVHPRVRKDFYKEPVHPEWFSYALENSKNPLCYNGDILTKADADAVTGVDAVMIGRGLIADPGMLLPGGTTIDSLEAFLNELLETYTEAFGGSRNAMFRMKENWGLLHSRFDGGDKLWKRLLKTTDVAEYKAITAEILHTLPRK